MTTDPLHPFHRLSLVLILGSCCVPATGEANWGADFANGKAEPLLAEIRPQMLAILKAPADERPALIDALVADKAASHIEALKRFRNPEFLPLFRVLVDSEDWRLQHRALYVLEYFGDTQVLPRAWELLRHHEPRMREKAAVTCIKLWTETAGVPDAASRVRECLRAEESLHVRRCLELLQRRMQGKHEPRRVHEEYACRETDGLMIVPVIEGLSGLETKAPGYSKKVDSQTGSKGASKLPVADRWTTPLLMWGLEEVKGASLQPFGNPREGGRVHTGQDVGASLEGCGFYACADGFVRLVHTGSDMGTLIVTEHHLEPGRVVNSVYMHGGDTVFVAAGDEIRCGQLLTTQGMGFSIENGGHYAHLHHGLYPGEFSMTHNYGYKRQADGLADWLDPAEELPRWMERSAPIIPELRPLDPALDKAIAQVEKGRFGKAYSLAVKVVEDPPSEVAAADAAHLVEVLSAAADRTKERAASTRDLGYPAGALDILSAGAKGLKGIPGSDSLAAEAKAWKKDAAFKTALKAEAELESTWAKVQKMKRKQREARELDIFQSLLDRHGDTVLRERIQRHLDRLNGR